MSKDLTEHGISAEQANLARKQGASLRKLLGKLKAGDKKLTITALYQQYAKDKK